MNKDDIRNLLDQAFEYGKKLINQWHDGKMEQSRINHAEYRKQELARHANAIDEIKYNQKIKRRMQDGSRDINSQS